MPDGWLLVDHACFIYFGIYNQLTGSCVMMLTLPADDSGACETIVHAMLLVADMERSLCLCFFILILSLFGT